MTGGPDSDRLALNFVSTRSGARVVGAAFVLTAAVGWFAAAYDIAELRTLSLVRSGFVFSPGGRIALSQVGSLVAGIQLASAGLVAAVFLPWLYQARSNLRALGVRRLRYSREWTYLAFVVPGVNAYRPFQIVSEVWRASDPASGDPLAWRQIRVPRILLAWWVAFAAWVALEVSSAALLNLVPGVISIQLALMMALAADVCAAASASLGYFIAIRISTAQDAKWSAFGGGDLAATASFMRGAASA